MNSRVTKSSTLIVTSCTVFDLNNFSKLHYSFPLNLDGSLVSEKNCYFCADRSKERSAINKSLNRHGGCSFMLI